MVFCLPACSALSRVGRTISNPTRLCIVWSRLGRKMCNTINSFAPSAPLIFLIARVVTWLAAVRAGRPNLQNFLVLTGCSSSTKVRLRPKRRVTPRPYPLFLFLDRIALLIAVHRSEYVVGVPFSDFLAECGLACTISAFVKTEYRARDLSIDQPASSTGSLTWLTSKSFAPSSTGASG